MAEDHEHDFVQYRDHRPPRCSCGAWIRRYEVIVTDEPCPGPGEGGVKRTTYEAWKEQRSWLRPRR